MACVDVDMEIHGSGQEPRSNKELQMPVVRQYQATELMQKSKGPLDGLLLMQPAVFGSLQVMSGFLKVGVGILFAVTQELTCSLFTLFRVSYLTGVLFIIAGVVSNLLFKYPSFLPLSIWVNCGCLVAAAVSAILIGVDLAQWDEKKEYLRIETLILCVMGLEFFLSALLCFWFLKEKRVKSP